MFEAEFDLAGCEAEHGHHDSYEIMIFFSFVKAVCIQPSNVALKSALRTEQFQCSSKLGLACQKTTC